MLKYAAIVPHSPLLLDPSGDKYTKTLRSFSWIEQDLSNLNISNIISIAAHPLFKRDSFSVYTHPSYTIDMSEFGDLITKVEIPLWWDAYNQLRIQASSIQIELIDQAKLDYAHSVPLLVLEKQWQQESPLSILAINTYHKADLEDSHSFGKLISKINDENKPYAIICSGELAVTSDPSQLPIVHQQNTTLRNKIKNHTLMDFNLEESDDIQPPCLNKTLEILAGAISDNMNYEELSYEENPNTSFLVGKFS